MTIRASKGGLAFARGGRRGAPSTGTSTARSGRQGAARSTCPGRGARARPGRCCTQGVHQWEQGARGRGEGGRGGRGEPSRERSKPTHSAKGRRTNSLSWIDGCGTLSHHSRSPSSSDSTSRPCCCCCRESNWRSSPYRSKSRSITRGPFRNVPKSRPRSRSMRFSAARSSSGDCVVST